MKRYSFERFDAWYLVRDFWYLQDSYRRNHDLSGIGSFISSQNVLGYDVVAIVNVVPLCGDHFGIEDKVRVQSIFLYKANPIILNFGLEAMRFVPVGIEVRRETIPVYLHIRGAALDTVRRESPDEL